ncbi:MAG: sugar phosphate isomerase/epimerase, partial [Chitinophagaceae bacterium]
ILGACGSDEPKAGNEDQATADSTTNWELGVALWTFHNVDFPTSLKMADSAGIKLIEPNTFHSAGKELKDSLLGQLSPAGIEKLKSYVQEHNIKVGSLYLGGGKTVQDWKNDFEKAKQFGVRYVTAEPPMAMWDIVDSLAGVYGLKVAIHEHWKGTSIYWHPDSVLAAIKDHKNFGACADLGHYPKSGINSLDAVKKLEGHIIGIHLKDIAAMNDPKLVDVRVGTGIVQFPEIFAELKRQKFDGYIYIERDSVESPSNVASAIAAVKYFNETAK